MGTIRSIGVCIMLKYFQNSVGAGFICAPVLSQNSVRSQICF